MSSSDSKPDNYQINAKICRLVEQYPCMYDRSHPHYLKKDVVDKAWVQISKEMDDSIPSCKERWRNIRTSYARSINVNKVPSSANRTKPYYLHEELQFLARHITPGIPVSRRGLPNAFFTSPFSEKGEIIEVAVGEESFDGFAAMMQEEEEEEESQDRRSSSAASEAAPKHTQELEQEALLQQQQQQQKQQQQQQQQQYQHQPTSMMDEDEAELTAKALARDSIGYACGPPKKRLRFGEVPPNSEQYVDVKPFDLLPSNDFDGIFLQGLLPEMKVMDFRQKIQFKRRIYEVLSEIFDNSPHTTTATTSTTTGPASASASAASSGNGGSCCGGNITLNHHQPPPQRQQVNQRNNHQTCQTTTPCLTAAALPPTMTVVNASDLGLLRRLGSLLQEPALSQTNCSSTASPKQVSISSTVRSTPATPSTAHVAVPSIGATTRSSANLMRVRMVSAPVTASVLQAQNVKQEPETTDD